MDTVWIEIPEELFRLILGLLMRACARVDNRSLLSRLENGSCSDRESLLIRRQAKRKGAQWLPALTRRQDRRRSGSRC